MMAAGSGAASGHGGRGSSAALEATLDRRFQGVSNTMESIQGLSTWCIENKKYHSLIVRYWMKWLKKSDTNHRLNLFYLANDVIQNCKRKNAIVYRPAFAEVLPNAAMLVKDGKVRKSVERIFTIWEERSVYPEELISQLKINLVRKERDRERSKEKEKEMAIEREKEKEKAKETPPPPAPVNPKAALKSKIVADFIPQSFIEQLSGYKRAVEEEELRENQLTALRVDVCSTEALKRLKDKAGGNKFAKDFEDGSLKLQEFVTFLETQMTTGPPLLEALGNADVFYEMQYKEVKIVANAYNTFANRVANLKRKLDALKSSLPGPEDSPIPSPSEDAPSPTGSDSPFHSLFGFDPELDGRAMDEGDIVREGDNRDVEDMDLSEEETDHTGIIVEEKKDKTSSSSTVSKATKPSHTVTSSKPTPLATPTRVSTEPSTTPKKPAALAPTTATTGTPTTPTMSGQSCPATPLGMNLANVDLGKISSILSSITSAMKNTASPTPRPSPGTPTTPSGQSSSSKPPGGPAPPSPALASILSRVDITPEGILNALSKTNTQGLSSLLHSVTGNSSSSSATSTRASPETTAVKGPPTPTTPKTKPPLGNSLKWETPGKAREWGKERDSSPPPPPPSVPAPSVSLPSLESKINSFLQGNPGFSLGLGDSSPLLGGDGVDGTPVRDESGGTPTQDEIMDTPGASDPLGLITDPKTLGSSGVHNLSPTAYRSDPWDAVITPTGSSDSDFLSSSSSSSSRLQGYGSGKKMGAGSGKNAPKLKEEELMKMRKMSGGSSSSLAEMKGSSKAKKDGHSNQGKAHGNDRSAGERRSSAGSRKASSGSEEGGRDEKGKGGRGDGRSPGGEGEEGHYHRIETLVSPCSEGAPIHALGYSNRQSTGERIQTVESIRVIGQGMRRGEGAGGRPGGGMWYDEGGYLEAQLPSPHSGPPSLNTTQGGSGDMTPPMGPPPPPHLLLPPHAHPPPHSHPHPHPHPHPHQHQHPHSHPHPQFQMPYRGENPQTPPVHLHQHPPPPSPFFNSPPPPIPRLPPPPIPQLPSPPRNFLAPPSAVMVGGVLVPVDRPLPMPPPIRPEGGDRGGGGGPRGGKAGPPPLMSSLLGEPPKLPRPGTVKEHFAPRHAPPLHRPGTPGAPPPLLGRVKEGLNLPPPPHSPSSSSSSNPSSPSGDPRPPAPPLQRPPNSPPGQLRNPNPHHRPSSSPLSLLRLPSPNPRPPILSAPMPQRPLLRARAPPPQLNRDPPMFRGGKRPGPPFGGGQRGPFYPPKRPFLPPRY